MLSAICFNLDQFKNLSSGNGLKCWTRNLEGPGSSCSGSTGFCHGQYASEPLPSTDETQGIDEHVSCYFDMTEMILKAYKTLSSL